MVAPRVHWLHGPGKSACYPPGAGQPSSCAQDTLFEEPCALCPPLPGHPGPLAATDSASGAPGHAARTEEEEERWRKRRRKRRRKDGGGPEWKSALGRSADCSRVPSAPLQAALTTPGSGQRRVGQKEGQRSPPAPSPQLRHSGGSYRDDSLSAASEPPPEAGTIATSLYKLGILDFTKCPRPAPAPRGGSRTPGAGSWPLHKRARLPASGPWMHHFLTTWL